jgi:hypothetical protein
MARKASMWAKAAGEYYRKNKGKNGIESFSDVLKSVEFKQEYYAKYGKQGKTIGRKGKDMRNTRRYKGGDSEVNGGLPTQPQLPGGSNTDPPALPISADPSPSATTSSLSAAELPPSNPQLVTGGKRKSKSKSKSNKKRSAKKYF